MRVLKFAAAIGLAGLSLAGCVEGGTYYSGYGGGYGSYYDGYGYGYDGGYRNVRRYDNYPYRRWDGGYDGGGQDWHRDRRPDGNWQGQRPDRNQQGSRPNYNQSQNRPQPSGQPGPQNNPPRINDSRSGPYSPDSCGSIDCTGQTLRGSNR